MKTANRLIHETSPYLLQHAHNPVDWYAWKPEAFELAKQKDLPVLVSIGYSTCHWCHVMERESFEDPQIAAFMNQHFVNIKVDREERPDVDQIYMEACQAINGSGGWPLNCFLTPDGRPFYAGTYFPPQPAYRRPSWQQVLAHISQAYNEKRETIEAQADKLMDYISRSEARWTSGSQAEEIAVGEDNLAQKIVENLSQQFDREHGGFGGAPKFPGTMALKFLLDYHWFAGSKEAMDHVQLSLDKMILGGIYDQLGGGFARYATDARWLVPHFEKMLYDNALLVSLLADAFKASGRTLYKQAIEESLTFIEREMTDETGGFYSALDADSEGEEGRYYVWSKAEIEAVLGEEANLFNDYFGVSKAGNWEGHNILWCRQGIKEFSATQNMSATELSTRLRRAKAKLLSVRAERIRPGLDDKILLGWNALQCTAYAKAYSALGREAYRKVALKNMKFLLESFQQPGATALYHTYKEGRTQYEAFLDDYAFLIEALLVIYKVTFEEEWLQYAIKYADFVIEQFWDEEARLFYYTRADQKDIPLRRREVFDNALPSGNAVMAHCLAKIGLMSGVQRYRKLSGSMLRQMLSNVVAHPGAFGRWAQLLLYQTCPPFEVAVVGANYQSMARAVNERFLPGSIVMAAQKATDRFPLLKDKQMTKDTYIYVCRDYSCQLPVNNMESFDRLIRLRGSHESD